MGRERGVKEELSAGPRVCCLEAGARGEASELVDWRLTGSLGFEVNGGREGIPDRAMRLLSSVGFWEADEFGLLKGSISRTLTVF
jgi:hypothetical protein